MSMINANRLPETVQLLPHERALWVGRPHQGMFAFAKIDAFLVPFSIVWGGFAIFWNVAVARIGAPSAFRLFGLPFLFAGLYLMVGRFVHNKRIRSQTTYVLTTKRALIVRGRSVRDVPLSRGLALETAARSDGTGTIYFGQRASMENLAFNPLAQFKLWLGPAASGFTFYRIDDFQAVAKASRAAVNGDI